MTIILENYRRGDEINMCVADLVVHVHTSTSAVTLRGTIDLHRENHTPDGEWVPYGWNPIKPPGFALDAKRLLGSNEYQALLDDLEGGLIDQRTCDLLWPPEEDPAARAARAAYQEHLVDQHLARLEDRYGP